MLRKQVLGLFLLVAFILTGVDVFAQAKKGVDLVQPIQQEKPKGKEKLMIYNGDYLKAQLYGFVKFDMVYNTTDVANESGPFWVENQDYYWNPASVTAAINTPARRLMFANKRMVFQRSQSQRNGSFLMDMRSTRLGLNITGPTVLGADTMANIEMDFWGDASTTGTGERSGMPTMRHAYAKLEWKSTGTFLLIGQTWSVLMAMPAQPDSVTYIPFGQNGNLFQREPQVTLGQKVGNENYNLTVEVSAARSMGGDDGAASASGALYPGVNSVVMDDRGPGEASRYPGGRARLTLVMKPHQMVNITLGGSGHYQLEKHAFTYASLAAWTGATVPTILGASYASRYGRITKSYSAQAFAKISASLVTVVATYWRGNNMDTFGVGFGTGAYENAIGTKILAVPMQGGYGQVVFDLRKVGPIPIMLAAGYGGGMKSNRSYIPVGTRVWNEAILAYAKWLINDYLTLGFEFGRHQTKYKGSISSAIDYKYHTGLMFAF